MKKGYSAFTLVELLIVMAIIIILITAGLLGGQFAIQRAQRVKYSSNVEELGKLTEGYKVDNQGAPPTGANFAAILTALDSYMDRSFDPGTGVDYFYDFDSTTKAYLFCAIVDGDTYGYCTGTIDGSLIAGVDQKEYDDTESAALRTALGGGGALTQSY